MNKKSNKNLDIWKLVSLAILFLYILFLLYPLYKLLQNAFFTSEGKFTLEQFKSFFSQSYYVESIFNSLKVSGLATILTLIIGIFLVMVLLTFSFGLPATLEHAQDEAKNHTKQQPKLFRNRSRFSRL